MNKELQRIKIAEACGWTDFSKAKHEGAIQYGRKPLSCSDSWEVPDYLNDLNAMHEAVRKLTDSQRTEFRQNLTKVWTARYNATRGLFPNHDDSVNAPAKQRAEAFLRALNLWKP